MKSIDLESSGYAWMKKNIHKWDLDCGGLTTLVDDLLEEHSQLWYTTSEFNEGCIRAYVERDSK